MKCPKCKVNLKRRRITRGAKTVERENVCPGCGDHYFSFEMFQGDYESLCKGYEKKLDSLSSRYNHLKEKYDNLVNALGVVSQAVKEGKNTKRLQKKAG